WRPDPGHHRFGRRDARMVDDGLRHEHHRRLGQGALRLARVRDLEGRVGTPTAGRAALHGGRCRGRIHGWGRDWSSRFCAGQRKVSGDTGRGGMASEVEAGPPALHLSRWTVTSGSNVQSRGAVVIEAGDHSWQATATGNGAVDALYRAVDDA